MGGGTQPARQAPPPSICVRACGDAPPPFCPAPCTCNGAAQNPKACEPGALKGSGPRPALRVHTTPRTFRVGSCAHPLPGDARAGNNAEATRTVRTPLKWESDERKGAETVSARTVPLFPHAPPPPVSAYPPLRGMKDWVACKPRGEGLSRRVCRPRCATVSPQTVACRGSAAALGRGGMRDQEDTHAPHPSCRAQRDSTPFHHAASRLRKKKYIVNVNYISQ